MNGEYKEKLPFGQGDLIVTKNSYRIQFYFPGPDFRYNGTFFTINAKEIDSYVIAYRNNWKKYVELTEIKSKLGNEFSISGEMGMKISVGGIYDGICIYPYCMPLSSDHVIRNLLDSFEWAKSKGPEIMNFLKSY